VKVLFFGMLKDVVGRSEDQFDLEDGATLGGVFNHYGCRFPRLREMAGSILLARNQEFAGPATQLADGDEIAFLPPVSGGSDAPPWIGPIRIVRNEVDVAILEAAVADPAAGAICTFVGTTRENNVGRKVLRLEYEAYEAMALSEIRKLADEAGRRWEITRVAITHRIGVVEIGETSVAIAVSAPHRAEAFEACRFAIDRLKEIVPIWKKEHFEGGEVWIGCQTSHPPHAHPAK